MHTCTQVNAHVYAGQCTRVRRSMHTCTQINAHVYAGQCVITVGILSSIVVVDIRAMMLDFIDDTCDVIFCTQHEATFKLVHICEELICIGFRIIHFPLDVIFEWLTVTPLGLLGDRCGRHYTVRALIYWLIFQLMHLRVACLCRIQCISHERPSKSCRLSVAGFISVHMFIVFVSQEFWHPISDKGLTDAAAVTVLRLWLHVLDLRNAFSCSVCNTYM